MAWEPNEMSENHSKFPSPCHQLPPHLKKNTSKTVISPPFKPLKNITTKHKRLKKKNLPEASDSASDAPKPPPPPRPFDPNVVPKPSKDHRQLPADPSAFKLSERSEKYIALFDGCFFLFFSKVFGYKKKTHTHKFFLGVWVFVFNVFPRCLDMFLFILFFWCFVSCVVRKYEIVGYFYGAEYDSFGWRWV